MDEGSKQHLRIKNQESTEHIWGLMGDHDGLLSVLPGSTERLTGRD